MEAQLVSEFVLRTGANKTDALSCLNSWGWDLKRALIDYNDTSTTEYFNDRASGHDAFAADAVSKSTAGNDDHYNNVAKQTTVPSPVVQLRKSSIAKTHSIDLVDCKKFQRGISRATEDNVSLVSRARSEIAMDLHNHHNNHLLNASAWLPSSTTPTTTTTTTATTTTTTSESIVDSPDFTFTLPDITIYAAEFRRFLEKDLIECSTLSSLESANRLNWWADSGYCRRLWPLSTSGDGNCLLHAASLSMWGFHDRKLTLRSALHAVLSTGKYRGSLWRRWRFHQTRLNRQAGFVYSDTEWTREWDEIVGLASPEPRQSTTDSKSFSRRRSVALDRDSSSMVDDQQTTTSSSATYESLEEIHIFALAHVLRRTIIVVADTVLRDMNGEAMAPIPFGGVYLPFEIPAADCHRAPLLLTYDMAHFSALVSMECDGELPPALIPLTDFDNVLLPIQFCIDPGDQFAWSEYDGNEGNWALTDREHIALLKEYLDVVYATPLGTPEEELFEDLTDEEYDRRISESDIALVDDNAAAVVALPTASDRNGGSKSKAAKQLQQVAKQFGSISKSMSKKIKKNIGSISKIGVGGGGTTCPKTPAAAMKNSLTSSASSTQSFTRLRILCAQLQDKRCDYQEEMIRNYLKCAEERFYDAEKTKAIQLGLSDTEAAAATPMPILLEEKTNCINANCLSFGTAATSYMCPECFEKQKQQELIEQQHAGTGPRYGTGNSQFYTQADSQSHDVINRLPSVRGLNELDQTLYLSNSTFYNDKRMAPPPSSSSSSMMMTPHYAADDRRLLMHQSMSSGSDDDLYHGNNSVAGGTASVYSPGRTIIHKIVRQTVNLPPTSIDIPDKPKRYSTTTGTTTTPAPSFTSEAMRLVEEAKPCRTMGCLFFGNASSNFYCSKCCRMQHQDVMNTMSSTTQTRSQSKVLTDV